VEENRPARHLGAENPNTPGATIMNTTMHTTCWLGHWAELLRHIMSIPAKIKPRGAGGGYGYDGALDFGAS
jgi:hypothetical protein